MANVYKEIAKSYKISLPFSSGRTIRGDDESAPVAFHF